MRLRAVGVTVIMVILASASVATAEDKVAARQAYLEGSKHYDLNQFSEALDSFKRAYWNYEEPVFLYNIAQCLRALKRKPEALDFYRSYLRKAPNASNRVEVQKLIAELEQAVAHEKAITSGPPQGTLSESKPAAPTPEPQATSPPPSTKPMLTSAPPPPRDKPLWKKPWLWGVVAGAVVVAGVAITVGIVESAKDPSPSIGALKVN